MAGGMANGSESVRIGSRDALGVARAALPGRKYSRAKRVIAARGPGRPGMTPYYITQRVVESPRFPELC